MVWIPGCGGRACDKHLLYLGSWSSREWLLGYGKGFVEAIRLCIWIRFGPYVFVGFSFQRLLLEAMGVFESCHFLGG
jgi:hypothetical protein